MKGSCCECQCELPAQSRVDTALICSDCLEEHRAASLAYEIVVSLSGLDEDQLGHVKKLVDHLRGVNRWPSFESIGIKSDLL
jgi:hypothetical protein